MLDLQSGADDSSAPLSRSKNLSYPPREEDENNAENISSRKDILTNIKRISNLCRRRPIIAWRQCSQGICMLCETCGGTRLLLWQTDVQRRERGGEKARESWVLLSRHKYHPKTRLPSAGKSWHVGCHGRRRRHDPNMRVRRRERLFLRAWNLFPTTVT